MARKNNRVTVADLATIHIDGQILTWVEYLELNAAKHRAAVAFINSARKGRAMTDEEFRAYAAEMGA